MKYLANGFWLLIPILVFNVAFFRFLPISYQTQTFWWDIPSWFVPDTFRSVWGGFGPNAILNLVLATLYAIPLAATRPRLVDVRPRS